MKQKIVLIVSVVIGLVAAFLTRTYLEHKNAEADLAAYKDKLEAMLSSDKKAELEINAIAAALGAMNA